MGRKKIKIQPIKEDRNRSVTYLKRKAGLFKKAHELAVLTDSQVAVIVFGHNGKLAEFCSTDIDLLLLRYTEYEGAAERKGPQNYLNLDKDSDDNEDGDNDHDDNDNASGDDFASQSGANGGGAAGGPSGSNGRSSGRVSGIKRKAEPPSPPRNNHLGSANTQALGGFGASNGLMGVSPTAKQTINAAIRQKSQHRTAGASSLSGQMAGQGVFDPFSFGQTFMPAAGMPQNMAAMVPSSAMVASNSMGSPAAGSGPSVNPTRAETIASMSIPMPTNDRLPIFVSPATPGFGLTPGGTVTTPGGRRFSFSDVLPRGTSGSMMQRPVTANSFLGSTFFQNEAFGLAAPQQPAFHSISPSVSPQPPQDPSLSAATAAAAFAAKGAIEREGTLQPTAGPTLEASPTPVPDLRSNALAMSRPASTGVHRSVAPAQDQAAFAPVSGAGPVGTNNLASPAHIVRPFTASGNLEAPSSSTHLAPPVAGFAGSLSPHGLHTSSASPAPHPTGLSTHNAFNASAFVGSDLKPSATPLGSQTSSATPELIQPRNNAAPGAGLAASASRSSMSTDEETPPGQGGIAGLNATPFPLDSSRLDSGWLSLGQGQGQGSGIDQKAGQSNLVQPVPINATQTLGSVPFDLSFPAQPTQ